MIFDYPTFKVIWWILVGVLLVGFADAIQRANLPRPGPTPTPAGNVASPRAPAG